MLKVENTDVFGWEAAIRGMRNPMNSWNKSDSWSFEHRDAFTNEYLGMGFHVGEADLKLMKSLSKAGNDHGKFLRMINVTMDITAPLYWWKEFDTYKVGTVANSCSTMHKIQAKEFTIDDFSHEHMSEMVLFRMEEIINDLEYWRDKFLNYDEYCKEVSEFKEMHSKKDCWWQMIQLLPSSYNQKRTIQVNYQVLKSIYHARKNHKLDEWHTLCDWMLTLPYFKEICVGDDNE